MYKQTRYLIPLFVLLFLYQDSCGEAILIPHDDTYATEYHHLRKVVAAIEITDQVATTYINQTFDNAWDD